MARHRSSIERGSTDGYRHRAYSFTPDGQTIISGGGNGDLTAYDLKGQRLGDFVGHESDVWAVTPSPDGRLLVSGSADQTVRLWNLTTRELIATLFHGTDGEWVMWTPQGYYTSSPNGDKIVGWQINKGPDQAAEYVTASQLRNQFYRPDIVERAIVLGSAIQAVEEAGRTRAGSFQLSDLTTRPPPKLNVRPAAGGQRDHARARRHHAGAGRDQGRSGQGLRRVRQRRQGRRRRRAPGGRRALRGAARQWRQPHPRGGTQQGRTSRRSQPGDQAERRRRARQARHLVHHRRRGRQISADAA